MFDGRPPASSLTCAPRQVLGRRLLLPALPDDALPDVQQVSVGLSALAQRAGAARHLRRQPAAQPVCWGQPGAGLLLLLRRLGAAPFPLRLPSSRASRCQGDGSAACRSGRLGSGLILRPRAPGGGHLGARRSGLVGHTKRGGHHGLGVSRPGAAPGPTLSLAGRRSGAAPQAPCLSAPVTAAAPCAATAAARAEAAFPARISPAQRLLEATLLRLTLFGLSPYHRLLLAGCSDGARGAMAALDFVSAYLPAGVEVRGFLDSPPLADVAPISPSITPLTNQTQGAALLVNATARLGAACVGAQPQGEEARSAREPAPCPLPLPPPPVAAACLLRASGSCPLI